MFEHLDFDLIQLTKLLEIFSIMQATKELRDMHVCSLIAGVTIVEKEEEKKSFMDAGLDYIYQNPLTSDALHNLIER